MLLLTEASLRPLRDGELIKLEFYKQQMNRFLAPLLMALLCATLPSPLAEARNGQNETVDTLTVIRGRVVCLEESNRRADTLFGCDGQASRYAILDKDSKLYKFDPMKPSTDVFTDARVRARELQVTARVDGKRQLELIKVQSIKEGNLYDIYYFCEICNIRAYTPGPCPCCRNELEFRETPS
jgi:rubrerythrin